MEPQKRRGRPPRSPESRFREKFTERGPDECWEWEGGTVKGGYGYFRVGARQVGAHRFALSLALGRPLRPRMGALHSCDNLPCVNPAHLREGTGADNAADRESRGRHRVNVPGSR